MLLHLQQSIQNFEGLRVTRYQLVGFKLGLEATLEMIHLFATLMNGKGTRNERTLILATDHIEHMQDRSMSELFQLGSKQHVDNSVTIRARIH